MNHQEKLNAIITEYLMNPNNQHILTGTGGNYAHYFFLAEKERIFSDAVETFSVNDKQFISNPKFIMENKSKTIRTELDKVVSTAIEQTGFASPIRMVENKLVMDVDMEKESAAKQTILAAQQCLKFKDALEANNCTDVMYQELATHLDKLDIPIVVFAIRQMGIETVVKYNLDEHPVFSHIFKEVQKAIRGLERMI